MVDIWARQLLKHASTYKVSESLVQSRLFQLNSWTSILLSVIRLVSLDLQSLDCVFSCHSYILNNHAGWKAEETQFSFECLHWTDRQRDIGRIWVNCTIAECIIGKV